MASLFTRTYTFTDGTVAYGSQVEAEIANIVLVLNNLNAATTTWGQVSSLHNTSVPLIADCSSGSQHIADFKNNSVIKASFSSAGLLTSAGAAMGSNKITGLANGTAATDAATFGQTSGASTAFTSGTDSSSASGTYVDSNITATITPTRSTSKVLIMVTFTAFNSNLAAVCSFRLMRDSTDLSGSHGANTAFNQAVANNETNVHISYLDAPASTSSITYKLQYKTSAGTLHVGTTDALQSLALIEVLG